MTVNRDRNENSIQPINRTINPLHVRKKFSNHTDHRHFKSAGNGKIWQGPKDEEILAKFFSLRVPSLRSVFIYYLGPSSE